MRDTNKGPGPRGGYFPSPQCRSARTLLIAGVAAFAACGSSASEITEQPQTGQAPAVDGDAFEASEASIARLVQLPQLTKASVEGALSVTLTHQGGFPADQLWFEATLAAGPFGRVELFVPNTARGEPPTGNRIILHVREGVEIQSRRYVDAKLLVSADQLELGHATQGEPASTFERAFPPNYDVAYSLGAFSLKLLYVTITYRAPTP